MKVYALTNGCYSDYRVLALFSTRERAEEAMALIARPESEGIEEYDIDDPAWLSLPKGHKAWMLFMRENGDLCDQPSQVDPDDVGDPFWCVSRWLSTGAMRLYVIARDEDHAVKVAGEKWSQMIASGEWERVKGGGAA